MTPEKYEPEENECKCCQTLEEICENTRAIRRVVNRILDFMHDYDPKDTCENSEDYDPDTMSWQDLDNNDDMYM